MEHPFLDPSEIKKLKLEEIQNKITELTKKLTIAYQTGNDYLVHQVQMALETYNNAQMEKLKEMMPKEDPGKGKIDIS
jgi:hypothetical protein